MALNSSDKKLIDDVANDLRTRFTDTARMDGVSQEEVNGKNINVLSNSASTPVAITKDDLREISVRRIIRDAYLN